MNEGLGADYQRFLHQLEVVDSLAATRGLEGGGSGGNQWDLPKAAATRSRGERAQLDIQRPMSMI